jgi:hypothetical protein
MEQAIVAPMRLGFKRLGSRVQEAGFKGLRFKPAVRQKKNQ